MSILYKRQRKKNERSRRKRSEKALHRRRLRTKKYKSSGWKLRYPELFEEIINYPYIIRKKV